MKSLLLFCSILSLGPVRTVFAQAANGVTNTIVISPEFIDALAEEARTNHPALRAAEARADAAVWNAAAVRTWEDPSARFGVMGADREKRADDGDLMYGVEQKLPLFGKPQAARELAQAKAVAQRHEAAFRSLQLRRDLTRQLIKVALGDRTLELARSDLASLDTIVAATEDKYRNGFATQLELLQSQNERARRDNLLRTEENLLQSERVSLNRFLNRPVGSAWPKLSLPGIASNLPPLGLMVEHATAMAPQIDVMHASVREAESAARLARKQRWPDLSLGVEGRQFADTGEFREGVVTLGFSIPWANRSRYAAEIKREQRKVEAAQLELADMQLGLRDEITRLAIQIENARREATVFRTDIIPRTEQALSAAHVNWLNSRGTLRDVLEMRRMLLDAQTMEARAAADQHTLLADLLLHCGLGTLDELTAKHSGPAAAPERGAQ